MTTQQIPGGGGDLRQVDRDCLERSRIPAAQAWQRRGKTLSEIASIMRVSREAIIEVLYDEVVSK